MTNEITVGSKWQFSSDRSGEFEVIFVNEEIIMVKSVISKIYLHYPFDIFANIFIPYTPPVVIDAWVIIDPVRGIFISKSFEVAEENMDHKDIGPIRIRYENGKIVTVEE